MLTPERQTSKCVRSSRVSKGKVASLTIGLLTRSSIKLTLGCFLNRADAASFNLRARVVLAFDGSAGNPPQHRQLAHVRERIGDRPLKETFAGCIERAIGSKIVIETLQSCMKSLDFLIPWQRFSVVPGLVAFRNRQRPIKQVAYVGENLR